MHFSLYGQWMRKMVKLKISLFDTTCCRFDQTQFVVHLCTYNEDMQHACVVNNPQF